MNAAKDSASAGDIAAVSRDLRRDAWGQAASHESCISSGEIRIFHICLFVLQYGLSLKAAPFPCTRGFFVCSWN